ncbi:methyltransferase domain-containing protein [Phytohabitans aurantiacus]|uniref:methyltransferase domain-containing protein n=1 Tax=Phytohabitans aurantiacus TaxID=3016789 RepID=UPI00389AA16A
MRQLTFRSGSFDLVAASFVIHILDEPAAGVAEAYRVLARMGGSRLRVAVLAAAAFLPGRPRSAAGSTRCSGSSPRTCRRMAVWASQSTAPTCWRRWGSWNSRRISPRSPSRSRTRRCCGVGR